MTSQLTPASQIEKLRKLGREVPQALIDAHRAYHRESKNRCRKVKKLLGVRKPGRPMSHDGAPGFCLVYKIHLGVGVSYETPAT